MAAPEHGPSGWFLRRPHRRSRIARVRTDADGVAVAPLLAAGEQSGGYVVAAVVQGSGKRVAFALVNRPR